MPIAIGQSIPNVTVYEFENGNPQKRTTADLFSAKRVILFALPGAYTPTCSESHLPGFVVHADQIKANGIDSILCLSVNDAFVMGAWGQLNNADGQVSMIADGSAELTKAMDLALDLTAHGFGVRSQRYAMVVDNGVVESLHIEKGMNFEVSSAEAMLKVLTG